MVYNSNFVASVKWNGNILRESRNGNDSVFLPFGAEYSILLKNLNVVKALVNVEIDGREAISDLIIHPNDTVELERFFEDDMKKGHKFKFIEKSDDIKEFRGDKVEDGIIRITYKFEEKCNYWGDPIVYKNCSPAWWNLSGMPKTDRWDVIGSSSNGTDSSYNFYNSVTYTSNNISYGDSVENIASNVTDEGITVEGGESNQSFTYGNIGKLESMEHCINISLKGYFPGQEKVEKPLTVKAKVQCKYCGKKYKSDHKFCGNCGAALI